MSSTDDPQGHDPGDREDAQPVPAGRGGADSGAADLVDVEGRTAGPPDESTTNDIAGVGPGDAASETGTQDGPREDVHESSRDERLSGIVVQVQGDLAIGHISEDDIVPVLAQRLADAGIEVDDTERERLARQALSQEPPTSFGGGEPGADA